jgi:hypothetical protein
MGPRGSSGTMRGCISRWEKSWNAVADPTRRPDARTDELPYASGIPGCAFGCSHVFKSRPRPRIPFSLLIVIVPFFPVRFILRSRSRLGADLLLRAHPVRYCAVDKLQANFVRKMRCRNRLLHFRLAQRLSVETMRGIDECLLAKLSSIFPVTQMTALIIITVR